MIRSVFLFAVVDQSSEGDKTGVTKKVLGQVRGFEENGLLATYIKRDDDGYWLTDGRNTLCCLS